MADRGQGWPEIAGDAKIAAGLSAPFVIALAAAAFSRWLLVFNMALAAAYILPGLRTLRSAQGVRAVAEVALAMFGLTFMAITIAGNGLIITSGERHLFLSFFACVTTMACCMWSTFSDRVRRSRFLQGLG